MRTRKMRMLAASLALVMCVSLYSAPKAKAVAVETAFGIAVVATFLTAAGLYLAPSAGSTSTVVSTGVDRLVTGFCDAAEDATQTSLDFYNKLVANTSLRADGTIALSAAAVVAMGRLLDWIVDELGLQLPGDTAVAMPGTGAFCLYNGVELPNIEALWGDKVLFPYAYLLTEGASAYRLILSDSKVYKKSSSSWMYFSSAGFSMIYKFRIADGVWSLDVDKFNHTVSTVDMASYFFWSNTDILVSDGSLFLSATAPVPVGDVQNQLDVTRTSDFTQPATDLTPESEKQMVVNLGLTSAPTMEDFSAQVLDRVVAGNLATTYEIVDTQTGEGTDPEPDTDKDESIYPYFPVLGDIKTKLDTLGDSIVDGIIDGLKSLVVPDDAFFAEAIPALQETFQGRMGLLTFPISLMADFLDRLLTLSDQEPILRWDSVRIYGTQLIAAGQYNLKDSLASARVRQMYDIYMVLVNAILVFAFLGLCQNKYRKIMQN